MGGVLLSNIYKENKFVYQKRFKSHFSINGRIKQVEASKQRTKFYTEDWDKIRKNVYTRDGYRCAICGKKGKLHAHHIIPVKISKDNSMSNLISLCNKHHRQLEMIGFTILEHGGGRAEVRRVELKMIMEAKKERLKKYIDKKEKKKLDENRFNIKSADKNK